MKPLPEKYYLTHFHEFLGFIAGPSEHLLGEEDKQFIRRFNELPEDAQCLYVRTLNRKSPLIKRQSLFYPEINDHDGHLDQLKAEGFLYPIEATIFEELISVLTKPELAQLLLVSGTPFKKSGNRASLFELVAQSCNFDHAQQCNFEQDYVLRGYQNTIDYFLFLFFGNLSSGLNKFSMRDMGIMRTKTHVTYDNARFDFLDEAQSAFFYAQRRKSVERIELSHALADAAKLDDFPIAVGTLANTLQDQYLSLLGKRILAVDNELALSVLSRSSEPEAQEKVIRERYKAGDKEWVQTRLQDVIDNPESEALLVFCEDFLARKFGQKRTSALTDMLREPTPDLNIDEIYMDSVEYGVKQYYQQKGDKAFRTENRLWRALFGLVFWQELFETDTSNLITEFDFKPQAIVHNTFYDTYFNQIEARLAQITDFQTALKQINKTLLLKYGKANGLFHWHSGLMEVLSQFLSHAPLQSVVEHLRAMAKDFRLYSDGYPDLMVIDADGLRFEEIKAPGDQLRKNQLISIRQLRKVGFNVAVTQVKWHLDVNQPYVVVDIETTGGRGQQDRITEIGMVKVVNNQVVDQWQSLINPQRHIPRNITQLTGIDNAMVADAPLFVEIADTLREFLAGSVFVAHNVAFDYGFIRHEFARLEQPFRMPKLCTVREMRKAVPGLPSYSLANLTKHFSIDMTRHHRALSDAQAAAELLFIINEHRQAAAK